MSAMTPTRRAILPLLALVLSLFAAVAYGPALSLPFMGDDYVFLEETRAAGFLDLWSPWNTHFGWYRPWSRELHFWSLQKVAGLHGVAYRTSSLLLWIVGLLFFGVFVRRIASTRVALVATLGVASLALWGTPLLWISGSQDLWMICFVMASLLLFTSGRTYPALLAFGLALLSKETAAVLPLLLGAYLILVDRVSLRSALRRAVHFWVLASVWFLLHPTLLTRLLSGAKKTLELEHRPPPYGILVKTLLSAVNLDIVPRPAEVGWGDVLQTLGSAAFLGFAVVLATSRRGRDPGEEPAPADRARLARFGMLWAVAGWFPLFLPSIGWHAYYGCLGALGAWLALSLWLAEHRSTAVAVITCLAVLRGAHARTMSWDWGNEWYQRRAGNLLAAIQANLVREHPVLPPHSRVFFAHIPNNIGLIAGQSPALRVWYRDSTLQAGFYSYYQPRPASADVRGQDFFFRFDTLAGLVEIHAGAEDVARGTRTNPAWEHDHEVLATLFLRSGDVPRAAVEFEKLSRLPRRPDAAVFAGVCREVLGDRSRADSLFAEAAERMRVPRQKVIAWAEELRRSMPSP